MATHTTRTMILSHIRIMILSHTRHMIQSRIRIMTLSHTRRMTPQVTTPAVITPAVKTHLAIMVVRAKAVAVNLYKPGPTWPGYTTAY
ncbi:MAG: hypothetical protein ACOYNO_11340 [Saprospiraceae bacterium]